MIVSQEGNKTLNWRVHRKLFHSALIVLTCMIVLIIGGVFFYGKLTQRAMEASHLRRENKRLRERESQMVLIQEELERIQAARLYLERLLGADQAYSSRPVSGGDYEFQFGIRSFPQALVPREGEILIGKELEEWLADKKAERELTPTGLPVSGMITARFGEMTGFLSPHTGVDIALKEGTPVRVTASGLVEYADWHPRYGNLVIINHLNGYKTKYGHASKIIVEVGQWVNLNDTICLSGNTGKSLGPHLHYEVVKNNIPIDPIKTQIVADSG